MVHLLTFHQVQALVFPFSPVISSKFISALLLAVVCGMVLVSLSFLFIRLVFIRNYTVLSCLILLLSLTILGNIVVTNVSAKPAIISPLSSNQTVLGDNTTPVHEVNQQPVQYYQVKNGDSLWKIAKKYYGSGSRWKSLIGDTESTVLHPGMVIIVRNIPLE